MFCTTDLKVIVFSNSQGCGGGLEVSILEFCSRDPSSNLAGC